MKRNLLPILVVLIIIVSGAFYFANTSQSKQQANIMTSLFKTYYNADNYETFDTLMEDASTENRANFLDNLYQEKYRTTLSKDAYRTLVANRTVLEPEQIVKDFNCTLELLKTDFSKEGTTLDGYPTYSYKAYIKVSLPNLEKIEVIETGTINFTKDKNKWEISLFRLQPGVLYNKVSKLVVDSCCS